MFPKRPGLHRMISLMDKLGNPQEKLKIIHVAGTNGKGSVCAMIASVLMEAGYVVGLFTSPHLINYNERIQKQGIPIEDYTFVEIGMKVKEVCLNMTSSGEEMPTLFEYLTAMAFLYFKQSKVDIVVLETGIGGKYDATNIILNPITSVITSIGKDHISLLGDTIEEITCEKAGIIKENCPIVLYDSDNTVYNIINCICKTKNSLLFSCKGSYINKQQYSIEGTTFSVSNKNFNYKDIRLHLVGQYQVYNATTTLMAIEVLRLSGYKIPNNSVYKGLRNTKWAGRMEVIQKNPTIIMDGAHNEESVKAFTHTLFKINQDKKVCLLIAILKDKDYKLIIERLLPLAHTIIATQIPHPRTLSAQELCYQINCIKTQQLDSTNNSSTRNSDISYPKIIIEENLETAYKIGKKMLNKQEDILCCIGSLYLVGELKSILQKQEDDNVRF